MRYLLQVWFDGRIVEDMPPAERAAFERDVTEYDAELKRRGHLIVARPLFPPATAVTVKVRQGRISSTDGPFAETKEHLGGFLIVEAKDREEAVRLAAGIPLAKFGSIEVRQIATRPDAVPDDLPPGA